MSSRRGAKGGVGQRSRTEVGGWIMLRQSEGGHPRAGTIVKSLEKAEDADTAYAALSGFEDVAKENQVSAAGPAVCAAPAKHAPIDAAA